MRNTIRVSESLTFPFHKNRNQPVSTPAIIFQQTNPMDWTRPDLPSRCNYTVRTPLDQSPHVHKDFAPPPRIAANATELIGNTKLVRLNRIPQSEGVECEIVAKCEFQNIAGSVKDRIAKRMIEEAENQGLLKPGDTLIESTSGNTGIGLALVAAAKGYQCIIVMPEKMSQEKEYVLRGLGAEIVRTRTSADFDDPDSHIRVAEELKRKIGPTAHILNQYTNPYNPIEHFDQTAEEILRDCTETNGKIRINMLVAGAGTGGTVTGLSRKIKRIQPNCQLINPMDWTRPDLPSKCTYTVRTPLDQSPHVHKDFAPPPRIAANATELIGNTKLVRLNRIPQSEGVECEIVAKCEFQNIAGSVKDRIAKRMIEEAENQGLLKPGDTLIEPTSGNTGIGLALVAAAKGYRCIIVMPEKMSQEKVSGMMLRNYSIRELP
ncbi:unnamed protein product [Dicrocoelium dendriticum]|nr:unnamed protein product [Dicrocoelium dendriticum]